MKKITKYQLMQALNFLRNKLDYGRPLKWVYVYGHHRGGTTYMMNQYLKISKRVTADWMLHEFANAFDGLERRNLQKMNSNRLKRQFRCNLLANALIGGGSKYDIVVKQANGGHSANEAAKEIRFLTELFGSEPCYKVFMFREPHGYYNSAKIKFPTYTLEETPLHYKRAFKAYHKNGGIAVEYGPCTVDFLNSHIDFQGVKTDPFIPKPLCVEDDVVDLEQFFYSFRREVIGAKNYVSESDIGSQLRIS